MRALAFYVVAVLASVAVATDCFNGICLLQKSASLIKPTKVEPSSAKQPLNDDSDSTNATLLSDSEPSPSDIKTFVASETAAVTASTTGATPNKQVVTILEVLSLGLLGIDRIYLGCFEANKLNIWLGIVKCLTFGGCGIWAAIDWFAIITNALTWQASIDFMGMSFTWEPSSIQGAHTAAVIGVILVGLSCLCFCCLFFCASVTAAFAAARQNERYTPKQSAYS